MADLSIDVTQLKKLSADLRRVSPTLQKDFLGAVGLAGDVVASEVKSETAWSSRIPGSVRKRRRGLAVSVQVGGDAAPEAAPLNNNDQAGSFRHPVFGNRDVWVSQKARPFAAKSLEVSLPAVDALMFAAVDDAFVVGGFR